MIPLYTIQIDESAYCGETDETEDAPGRVGVWQDPPRQQNRLATLGGEAYVITGDRNLGSHVERLLARKRAGSLDFETMTIRARGYQP